MVKICFLRENCRLLLIVSFVNKRTSYPVDGQAANDEVSLKRFSLQRNQLLTSKMVLVRKRRSCIVLTIVAVIIYLSGQIGRF